MPSALAGTRPRHFDPTGGLLRGEWRRACLFTYEVEPRRLEKHLPPGVTLDVRNGSAFVSLVALDFLDMQVLGMPWPGAQSYPQVNFRFYVREGERRGVVFLREHVPVRSVARAARLVYNEPYTFARMESHVEDGDGSPLEHIEVVHRLDWRGRTHTLRVVAAPDTRVPPPDSLEHYFDERRFGYARSRRNTLVRYEVRHPVWAIHPIERYTLDWDFGQIYGREWRDLNDTTPINVALAEGSAVGFMPRPPKHIEKLLEMKLAMQPVPT